MNKSFKNFLSGAAIVGATMLPAKAMAMDAKTRAESDSLKTSQTEKMSTESNGMVIGGLVVAAAYMALIFGMVVNSLIQDSKDRRAKIENTKRDQLLNQKFR